MRKFVQSLKNTLAALGLILLILMFTPMTDWLGRLLYLPNATQRADAIIVLGAWASPEGELNESGLRRALLAARLYRDRVAPVVVITGADAVSSGANLSVSAMAQLLIQSGVPVSAVTQDVESSNTHDSAVRVTALARRRQWSQVALVTDATHMLRGVLTFRRAGLKALPRSTLQWDLGGEQPTVRLRKFGAIAHEYGALIYYWWREWI